MRSSVAMVCGVTSMLVGAACGGGPSSASDLSASDQAEAITTAAVPPPVTAAAAQSQVSNLLVSALPQGRFAFVGPFPLSDPGSAFLVAESATADGSSVFHGRGQNAVDGFVVRQPLMDNFDIALLDAQRPKTELTFYGPLDAPSTCTVAKTVETRDASHELTSFNVIQPTNGSGKACTPLEYDFGAPTDVSTLAGAAALVPHYPSLILEAQRRGIAVADASGKYAMNIEIDGLATPTAFSCGHDAGSFYGVIVDVVASVSPSGAPIQLDSVQVKQVKASYCSGSATTRPIPVSIVVTTSAGHFQTGDLDG